MTSTANEIVVSCTSGVVSHDVEALVQAAVSVLTNDMQIATHDQSHVTSQHDQNTVQLLVDTCATNNIQDRLYMCTDCNLAFYGEQGEQEWQWHLKQHKPYKCDLCSEAFEMKESLKTHMRSHTMQMPFICEKCGSAYSLKTNLVQHMKSHEEKLYQCGDCNVIFKSQTNLEKHLKFHTGETIKVFQCEQCSKTFSQQKNLVQHMKIHMGGDKAFKCSECPASYSYKCHLTRHLMIHSGDKPYKCKFCGKSFNRNAHLIRHRKIHSGDDKQWKCSQCGFAFWEKSDLLRHMKSHEGNRPYQCEFCEQTFVWRRYLLKHLRTSHRADDRHFCQHCCHCCETPESLTEHESSQHPAKKQLTHTCELCSQEFYFKYKLDEHMYQHTGRKAHACEKCPQKFISRKELDRHVAEHSQEVSFCCNTCQKTFSSIDQLQMHVKLHTGSGKYPCSMCGAAFKWKSQLNSHMVVHSTDSEFTCSACNKHFKRKRDLTRHVKIYHDTHPPYTCTECNRDFHSPYNLHKHKTEVHWRRIDADDREFACSHCTGVFRIKTDLDRHLTKVHPPRPFACTMCQKRFTMMKFLEKHFELKHEDVKMVEGVNYMIMKIEQPEVIEEVAPVDENGNQADVDNEENQDIEMGTYEEDVTPVGDDMEGNNGTVVVMENNENMTESQFDTLLATPLKMQDGAHVITLKHPEELSVMDTSDLRVPDTVSMSGIQMDIQHQQPLSEAITLAHLAQTPTTGVVPMYLHEVLPSQTGAAPIQQQQPQVIIHIDQSQSGNAQVQTTQNTIVTGSQSQKIIGQPQVIQSSLAPGIKTTQQLIQAHVRTIPQPRMVKVESKPAQSILPSSVTSVTSSDQLQQIKWQKIVKQEIVPEMLPTMQSNVANSGIKILPLLQTVDMPVSQQENEQNVVEVSEGAQMLTYSNEMDQVNAHILEGLVTSEVDQATGTQTIIISPAVSMAQPELTVQEETIEISPDI